MTWNRAKRGRFAYGRPLAWFDDDFALRAGARERFLVRRDQPTLLVPVDPSAGLTAADLDVVARWRP